MHLIEKEYNNPFYHNYIFKNDDIKRFKISKWKYPILFFLPTYCQISDNYVFYFKVWRSQYFLMGYEEL